jgi:hypothetical protein
MYSVVAVTRLTMTETAITAFLTTAVSQRELIMVPPWSIPTVKDGIFRIEFEFEVNILN